MVLKDLDFVVVVEVSARTFAVRSLGGQPTRASRRGDRHYSALRDGGEVEADIRVHVGIQILYCNQTKSAR